MYDTSKPWQKALFLSSFLIVLAQAPEPERYRIESIMTCLYMASSMLDDNEKP